MTDAELKELTALIRNETTKFGNTRARVADTLDAIIDNKSNPGGGIVPVFMGYFDASGGAYPVAGMGSGSGGQIKNRNHWEVEIASHPDIEGNVKFPIGAIVTSLEDNPGQNDAKWRIQYA